MARPTTLADLNEDNAYDTLLSIDLSRVMVELPEILAPVSQIGKAVQSETSSGRLKIRKQGDVVDVRILKKGREAQLALKAEQERWDCYKAQYYRVIEGEEPFSKNEYLFSLWGLNQWAIKENLPEIAQEVYEAAKVMETDEEG